MSLLVSFVIPVFNEQETLRELYIRLVESASKIDEASEFVFINDGSHDKSLNILEELRREDKRVKYISLSRNFGHQAAITAGMDLCRGEAIIIMDADLQDPPDVALRMLNEWRAGYQVVHAKRIERRGESFFKKTTASLFYRLLDVMTPVDIPLDSGDFRLIDRAVLNAFLTLREHDRFVRGMFAWSGFKSTEVEFERNERFAGTTKYPFRKMVNLGLSAILSFSDTPLRIIVQLGVLMSILSFCYAIFIFVKAFFLDVYQPGWPTIATLILFLSGIQLAVIGVVGLYIGRIHQETKGRPLYLANEAVGFDHADQPERAFIASWKD